MQENIGYTLILKKNETLNVFLAAIFTLIIFILLPLTELTLQLTKKIEEKKYVSFEIQKPVTKKNINKKAVQNSKKETVTPKFEDVKHKLTPLQVKVELPVSPQANIKERFDFEFIPTLNVSDLIFDLNNVDLPPEVILQIPPTYPISARRLGKEGKVSLLFVVNDEGFVESIEVIDSFPDDTFISSATQAVKKWKFKPAMKDNLPVSVRVEQTLLFNLNE